jgi:hypothetical protein
VAIELLQRRPTVQECTPRDNGFRDHYHICTVRNIELTVGFTYGAEVQTLCAQALDAMESLFSVGSPPSNSLLIP